MAGMKHQCYECKRWGTRAMHQLTWGTRQGEWRCDHAIACEKRAYKLRWWEMTKRKDKAEESIKQATMVSSQMTSVAKNPDCDQHKLVEIEKSIGVTKWFCASCRMTLTSTVS